MTTVLRWPTAPLIRRAGDNPWLVHVELFNAGDAPVEVSGGYVPTGRLLDPAGKPVPSRQEQPYPMPASMRIYPLALKESRLLGVALSLLPDELAALPPGHYLVTEVEWGGMTAPDLEIEVGASGPETQPPTTLL